MNYTQAQIDRANAVSLEDFLRTQGETLIKSGREYRWKEHDSLTVRGNKWFRHSQSKGGYPIDFVMEFYGKSFPEAVQLLTGESAEGQSEASTAPPTAFHLPLHNRTADRAIQYLTESRGLNKTLVEAFLLSGDIYEDLCALECSPYVVYHEPAEMSNVFRSERRTASIMTSLTVEAVAGCSFGLRCFHQNCRVQMS